MVPGYSVPIFRNPELSVAVENWFTLAWKSGDAPTFSPVLGLGPAGRHTCQHALGAEVFVDFRPMDSLAITDNLVVHSLLFSGIR